LLHIRANFRADHHRAGSAEAAAGLRQFLSTQIRAQFLQELLQVVPEMRSGSGCNNSQFSHIVLRFWSGFTLWLTIDSYISR
jgi:hypothetical protein